MKNTTNTFFIALFCLGVSLTATAGQIQYQSQVINRAPAITQKGVQYTPKSIGNNEGQVNYGNNQAQGQIHHGNNQPQGQIHHGNNQPQGQIYQGNNQGNNQPQGQIYQGNNQGNNQAQGQIHHGNNQPQGQIHHGNNQAQGKITSSLPKVELPKGNIQVINPKQIVTPSSKGQVYKTQENTQNNNYEYQSQGSTQTPQLILPATANNKGQAVTPGCGCGKPGCQGGCQKAPVQAQEYKNNTPSGQIQINISKSGKSNGDYNSNDYGSENYGKGNDSYQGGKYQDIGQNNQGDHYERPRRRFFNGRIINKIRSWRIFRGRQNNNQDYSQRRQGPVRRFIASRRSGGSRLFNGQRRRGRFFPRFRSYRSYRENDGGNYGKGCRPGRQG